MKKKTVYIAGQVTGLDPVVVEQKFSKKQSELVALGYNVYNPIALVASAESVFEVQDPPLFKTWEDYMKFLISYLIGSDELHLLPCWRESKGAILERDLASKLGITVIYP